MHEEHLKARAHATPTEETHRQFRWNVMVRSENGRSLSLDVGDPLNTLSTMIECGNVVAVAIHRGEEIKGDLPSLADMRRLVFDRSATTPKPERTDHED